MTLAATTPARRPSRTGQVREARAGVLKPGWPLVALLGLFPVWWALGLSTFVFPILAVPMALHLLRVRTIRVPPGFGLWLLFLLWSVAGAMFLGLTAPGTVPGSAASRLISFTSRTANYLAATVVLLYVGNMSERHLPTRRVVKLLGLFGLIAIAGGVLGVLAPTFNFTSPLEMVLPHSLASNDYVRTLVHPAAAQNMDVLGYSSPRPKAPFEYTNVWGNCLSVLLIYLIVGWWSQGRPWQRWVAATGLVVSTVPIFYSLNRGMWIGLALSILYVAFRLAAQGRLVTLGGVVFTLTLTVVVFIASPLAGIVQDRLAHPHSDSGRSSASIDAVRAATGSPLLGYGGTRSAIGSSQSIAVGKSPQCPRCGNTVLGGNGQLWLLIIANGFVGAFLYIAFFIQAIWRYWRDRTAIGLSGVLVLLLSLWYMVVYNALVAPLVLYFIAYALVWRQDMERRARAAIRGRRTPLRRRLLEREPVA